MDKWVASFIAGCMSALIWTELPPVWLLPVFFAAALVALRWRHGLFVSGLIFGTLWMASVGHSLITWQLSLSQINDLDRVTGMVVDVTVVEKRTRFTLRVDSFEHKAWWQHWLPSPLVRLSWNEPCVKIGRGDIVSANVRLKPVHGLANQGGFNYQVWLRSQGVNATGYVTGACALTVYATSAMGMREALISRVASYELDHSAIIRALSFGDRSDFTPQLWTSLQKTGLSHLIAISGLHLTVVAGLCMFCLNVLLRIPVAAKGLPQRVNLRVFILLLTVVACYFYAALSGMALPVTRALVALAFVSLLVIWRCHWSPFRIWLYCIWILLCFFPSSILTASFWLSVLAVGFILFLNWSFRRTQSHLAWLDGAKALLLMQAGLCVLMIPVTGYFFSMISLVAVIINLVAIPLVTLVLVPLCFLATVLAAVEIVLGFEGGAYYVFLLVDSTLKVCMPAVNDVAQSDWASVSLPPLPLSVWFLCLAGVALACLPVGRAYRALALVLCLPLFSYMGGIEKPGRWQVDVMDVGQGLAVVISKNNKVLLYDVGASFDSGFNMADAVIVPLLASRGIEQIDEVFISHYDNDHAGALGRLRETVDVNVISDNRNRCVAGIRQWQGLTLTVFWPQHPLTKDTRKRSDKNAHSCVLRISDGQHSVLLPGDIGQLEERELISRYSSLLASNVLIAPHHGSNTSSSDAFIKAVNPDLTIFSQGFQNRWHFPDQQVVNRYVAGEVELLATSEAGQISITFDTEQDASYTVLKYRQDGLPFWYANDI